LGKHAHQNVIKTVEEIKKVPKDRILVCGGNEPGHSTDFDSALFAKAIKADLLIKATDVDGVYSSDPDENPEAKKFYKLNYKQFKEIISKNKQEPGQYRLFDLSAIRIIEKSKTKLVIINGNDPEEIIRAVEGRDKGTRIM
ncbi:MAG: UMP kinase, partial [Candidatus Aenigmarchaeota archaeon]|nr:UMP kinase [Candidatus Aenigmarchaeota archaeon]